MRAVNLLILLLTITNSFAQDYKKDGRSKIQKESGGEIVQTESIDTYDIVRALDFSGVNIFKFPLKSFDKKYKLSVILDEFVGSKKVRSKNISPRESNIYYYFIKTDSSEEAIRYYDFIDQITFYSQDLDSLCRLSVELYGQGLSGIKLHKRKGRSTQGYTWRRYANIDWVVGKAIPMLVYGSSWYDKKAGGERFCGASFLRENETQTMILLQSSPHYYVISYKISE